MATIEAHAGSADGLLLQKEVIDPNEDAFTDVLSLTHTHKHTGETI